MSYRTTYLTAAPTCDTSAVPELHAIPTKLPARKLPATCAVFMEKHTERNTRPRGMYMSWVISRQLSSSKHAVHRL